MAIGDIIVGIDVGASRVCTVVGRVNNFNQIEIVCSAMSECNGLNKTRITDRDSISSSIKDTIRQVENLENIKINSAYVNIPGKYVDVIQNTVLIEVKDKFAGVSMADVQQAIMSVKNIEIPDGKILIDIVPDKFTLDNGKVKMDPVGTLSSTLALQAQLIFAQKDFTKEIVSIVRKSGIEIDGIVPSVLAERQITLDTQELSENVFLINIRKDDTDLGLFEKSNYSYSNTIPIGGDNITNDIALVLNISIDEAEKLKRQYGLALKSYIDNDNDIILNTYRGEPKIRTIKSSELVEIIEARIEEIFSLINKDVQSRNLKSKIGKVILTGEGISNINKSDVAGKIILNIPVKPVLARTMSTIKPVYTTAYAIVKYISNRPFAKTVTSSIDQTHSTKSFITTIIEKIKDFFYS